MIRLPIILFLFAAVIPHRNFAQQAAGKPSPVICEHADQTPKSHIDTNHKSQIIYPEAARMNGIQGKVQLQFVINEDGSMSDIKILKGLGHGCDEEAIRAVKAMGTWEPGIIDGKPVKVLMKRSITFKLED